MTNKGVQAVVYLPHSWCITHSTCPRKQELKFHLKFINTTLSLKHHCWDPRKNTCLLKNHVALKQKCTYYVEWSFFYTFMYVFRIKLITTLYANLHDNEQCFKRSLWVYMNSKSMQLRLTTLNMEKKGVHGYTYFLQ